MNKLDYSAEFGIPAYKEASNGTDFSVVLFRSDFVLISEKNHVKALKNQ